ncbi:tyrosine/phenylalanine carboxypeptidase domain-containing protein [Croceicoccus sp. YJ47]|uniref:tyrosine/phenylalanine carboxypeptidase domain-containing protein n=1 Tax=Croceicoccus sp. YJ47 TaxID=2798724 RepID=UPI001924A3B7|nr:tyrosine/phenylalanine carboxypeptidase domain-containing protein [Croceicoccus sp. YJ47]QQN73307.1 DUF1704 domain-containing protein [Croceicoccus sp. YJ47]
MMHSEAKERRAAALCDAAIEVDKQLAEMDMRIDWLTRLTPVNIDDIAVEFQSSGYRTMPDSTYGEGLVDDAPGFRKALFDLPVREIANPRVQALLLEKQRELDRQIELVRMRDCDGFIMASIDLFGHVDEQLLDTATRILADVPVIPRDTSDVDADYVRDAAEAEVARYKAADESFECRVIIDETPGTSLYTSMGNFHIAFDYRTHHARVAPLIQHEVGTHVVTRHNGRMQPLRTLAGGLADYDELQEGIAVLAEYLAGYLPAARLRLLAARVVAAHMAVKEESGPNIYACLTDEHGIGNEMAFDTAVRAKRGGGLTKDALYLKGLAELLAHLRHGGDFEILFLGKFALKQLPTLEHLLDEGIVRRPAILPTYVTDPPAIERLARVRNLSLESLYQERPET